MKMKKLFLLLLLFTTTATFAQKYDGVESTASQKEQAEKLTQQYNDYLSLTEDQMIMMEQKIAEFLAKRNAIITSSRSIEEKNRMILTFYKEETGEMNDILTRVQLKQYRKIKPEIQPLLILK